MKNPYDAIHEWWKIVKEGGYLYVVVPDEDLYEQGVFPSRWNADHKFTFTIYKNESWSNNSINVLDIIKSIPGKKGLERYPTAFTATATNMMSPTHLTYSLL